MGDDITIGVTEIVNNIEVTAQPNDQIVDISVIDNTDEVTLNITPTVIEINVNKGSSYAKWGTILGTLSDQEDLQDALDLKADLVDGKVPSSQLPSYVDDIIEVANYAALPATGETGKIYVTVDNNKIFRWTGSTYVEIIDSAAVWGAITGTLSSQTDLQTALDTKALKTITITPNAPLSGGGDLSANRTISISQANTSTNGYLSSTDWNTFNGKQAALNGTGFVKISGTTISYDNSTYALDNAVVKLTGDQSIAGDKTFTTTNRTTFQNGDAAQITFKNTGDLTKTLNIGHGSNGNIFSSTGLDFRVGGLTSSALLILANENATFKENLTAKSFIKSGGTSSQFLKADGSIDSTTYQTSLTNPVTGTGTTNYIPKFTGASAIGNSLIFDNGTSVGIGTASPVDVSGYKTLTINGTSGGILYTQVNGTTSGFFSTESSFTVIGESRNVPLWFATNNTIKGGFFANGNVGINTTTDAGYKLDVNGNFRMFGSSDMSGTFETTGTNNAASLILKSGNGTTSGLYSYLRFINNNTNQQDWRIGTYGDNNFSFVNSKAGTTPIVINTSGNVGIGTTSPAYSLDVNGVIRAKSGAARGGGYRINYSTANTSSRSWLLSSEEVNWGDFSIITSSTQTGDVDTTRLYINPSGNIGIGTTAPSEKLEVQSGTAGAKIKVSNTGGGYAMLECSSNATSTATLSFTNSLNLSGGSVGIGTTSPSYQLQLSTDSAAKPTSALWTIASDERIKENINSYTKGLNELLKINPITYDYNGLGGFKKGKGGVGIIAQEIAEILPDSVSSIKRKLNETDEEEIDILNFNGHELTYILINAVKELKAEIEILKNK